jgi:hypothetical protein
MDVSPSIVKRKGGESGLYYWRKGVKIWSFAENSHSVKNRSAGLSLHWVRNGELTQELKQNAAAGKP